MKTAPAEACLVLEALTHQIKGGTVELPLLPKVAQDVLAMTQQPDADSRRLSELLHQDQALASQVLRMANSPLYAPKVHIVSLSQAVNRLGVRAISEMAISAAIAGGIFAMPGHAETLDAVWRHSLATGAFAKELARRRRANVECAFLCGLMHSIGRPILIRTLVRVQADLNVSLAADVFAEIVDNRHKLFGALVAERWKLATPVCEAIRYVDRPDDAPKYGDDARTTALAALLATGLLWPDRECAEEVTKLSGPLNLYPEDIAAVKGFSDRIHTLVEALA
jgi:HD-like signal output (HDOD) protein